MEAMLYVKVLVICTSIWQISTDMQILVTKEQCGRSIELVSGNIVTLEHTGEELDPPSCAIAFVSSVEDEMICIRANSSNRVETYCQLLLQSTNSHPELYSCLDFTDYPACARTQIAFLAYTGFVKERNTLKIWAYATKYTPTTTSSPWSSTSYDDDDGISPGLVIGITVGIVASIVLFVLCVVACRRKSRATKPIYSPPAQFTPQKNQPQYPGTQSDQNYPEPSAPSPPYPGN